jgi:phospholipase D1/2
MHCTVSTTVLTNAGRVAIWPRLLALLVIGACILGAWKWVPRTEGHLEEFAAFLAAHRHDWYAAPIIVIAFVLLGLVMVPVVLLIAATGIAFGPLLGPIYAMAGCLASASTGFAIGRWVGLRRVQSVGGERVTRITRTLKQNGTLTVFLVRKVPAPFTLVNIVVGASSVRYRDFIIGTVLGMGAFVIGLAGFGHQLTELLRNPSPRALAGAAMFVLVPLTIALFLNHMLRRARSDG